MRRKRSPLLRPWNSAEDVKNKALKKNWQEWEIPRDISSVTSVPSVLSVHKEWWSARIALQKARALRKAVADVTAVSPTFTPAFRRLRIRRLRRRFRAADVARRILVIAATDSPQVNRAVSGACRKRRIPVNVVDDRESWHSCPRQCFGELTVRAA